MFILSLLLNNLKNIIENVSGIKMDTLEEELKNHLDNLCKKEYPDRMIGSPGNKSAEYRFFVLGAYQTVAMGITACTAGLLVEYLTKLVK